MCLPLNSCTTSTWQWLLNGNKSSGGNGILSFCPGRKCWRILHAVEFEYVSTELLHGVTANLPWTWVLSVWLKQDVSLTYLYSQIVTVVCFCDFKQWTHVADMASTLADKGCRQIYHSHRFQDPDGGTDRRTGGEAGLVALHAKWERTSLPLHSSDRHRISCTPG